MENKYPLYPQLTEAGEEEAQSIINRFKEDIKKVADEAIGKLYCDVAIYIDSDSWTNFRNELMDGFRDYNNRKIQGEYDFKEIRAQIYKEYREDINEDLNQDILKENEDFKKRNEQLMNDLHNRY